MDSFAIAFYNFINDKLVNFLIEKEKNAEIALAIKNIIDTMIMDGNKAIVYWKFNKDLEMQKFE